MRWTFRGFDAMRPAEIHAMLKLRIAVFVVEQLCPYQEVDDLDLIATHLLGTSEENDLVAYARIIPALPGGQPHIGRVLVHANHRSSGTGHELMRQVLNHLTKEYGDQNSALAAQAHLRTFYEHHGYRRVGPVYDLDGIPHVDMEHTT